MQKKFYQKTWFIVVMLIFFFPVGLFLMWKFSDWNKIVKIVITGLFVLGCIGAMSQPPADSPSDNSNKQVVSDDSKQNTKKVTLTPEQQFAKDNGLEQNAADYIIAASSSIGIPVDEITELTKTSDYGYTYNYKGYTIDVCTNEDGTVSDIFSGNVNFILEGNVLCQVQDKIITSEQRTWLITYAKDAVKANLKAPSTAEFPGEILHAEEWTVSRNGSTFQVASYVDAQNSFGAQIRSNFIVEFMWSGDVNNTPMVTNVQIQ